MKWRGRRQSTNIEEEAPLNPVKWSAKNEAGWRRPKVELPELPDKPTPIEGSELADLAKSFTDYRKDAMDRGKREGWMDSKYNRRDDNYKHDNFRRGGMIKGQCRDYAKK